MGLPPPPPPGPPSVLGCTVLSPTLPQVRRQSRLWLYLPHPRTAGLSRLHRPGLLRAPARDHRSMEQCQVDGGEASPACPSPPASLRATRAKKQGSASGHRRPPALLPGARGVQPGGLSPAGPGSFLPLSSGVVTPSRPFPNPGDHFFLSPPPQVSYTFSDYPPGVRHILFQHGGKDTQFWAGWYGPRVTNSSIVISPKMTRNLAPCTALPETTEG